MVDPSLTPAQRKAIDKENPWFARNFRMELTAKSMGNKVNEEIQKSGKILYYHFWNNSGNVETLILLDEGDYKIYQISSKNKVAQLKADFRLGLLCVLLRQDRECVWHCPYCSEREEGGTGR